MFGERLKRARIARGMTQRELARKIFVSHQAVGKWERGEATPNPETIVSLAHVLEVNASDLLGETPRPSLPNGMMIPVVGDVAAGLPIEAIQNVIDYEEVDAALADQGEYFGLRVRGASMEPRIKEGDVVIVRKQEDAETGDTVVVLVNGDAATVKRIKREPDGGLWLLPNNPAYEPRHYSPAEVSALPVTICGKVVELRAKF